MQFLDRQKKLENKLKAIVREIASGLGSSKTKIDTDLEDDQVSYTIVLRENTEDPFYITARMSLRLPRVEPDQGYVEIEISNWAGKIHGFCPHDRTTKKYALIDDDAAWKEKMQLLRESVHGIIKYAVSKDYHLNFKEKENEH